MNVAERFALSLSRPGAHLDEMEMQPVVERPIASSDRAKDIGRQPAVARRRLDEIKSGLGARDSGLEKGGHLGDLDGEQLAEDGPDVDAGKKIARAARSLGGAGVVAELAVVERKVHERGH